MTALLVALGVLVGLLGVAFLGFLLVVHYDCGEDVWH